MTQHAKNPDFTRERPNTPKVSQKPNFIVILNAWTLIPMQKVLFELEM